MTVWKRVKIIGTIKRECKYCKQIKELIIGEIVGTSEKLEYCKDCLKELYDIDFSRK